MPDFLLEIGTEELPARFLASEEEQLAEAFIKALAEAGLGHGAVSTFATPRRLAIFIGDVQEKQKTERELVMGPPAAIAWSASGEATAALLGFARTHGLAVEDIFRQQGPKGEYAAAYKLKGGRDAAQILEDLCPAILCGLHFPKRMRWAAHEFSYARPIRWILALLGSRILHFNLGPVVSGGESFGHRVHGFGPIPVPEAAAWQEILEKQGGVIADSAKRKKLIVEASEKLAQAKGGKILWKDSLLEEVCGLVEHPLPILGEFDAAYLEIPEEVLLTSMESHQKSFGLRDAQGQLMPYFLTVLNLDPLDVGRVKKGWERVLRARLEDARFFWHTDRADNMANWLDRLEKVIFIGPLGSMGEKSRRLSSLARWLAERVDPLMPQVAQRAGLLAKADLVSNMVGEFDSLQGIMGGIYAANAGEEPEVAMAIREQYLPAGPETPLPQTVTGSILAIAEKADTLAGCFGLNMIPGGAADPNGLRRCALGIIRILLDRKWQLSLGALFDEARDLYGEKKWKLSPEEARLKLLDFMAARLRAWFVAHGYPTPFVDAVLANGVDNIAETAARLDALTAFSRTANFMDSVQTWKRMENISRKHTESAQWQDSLLVEPAEMTLAAKLRETLPELDKLLANGEYAQALAMLEFLRAPVNDFFDQVMVNSDNAAIKANRMALLRSMADRFGKIARSDLLQL